MRIPTENHFQYGTTSYGANPATWYNVASTWEPFIATDNPFEAPELDETDDAPGPGSHGPRLSVITVVQEMRRILAAQPFMVLFTLAVLLASNLLRTLPVVVLDLALQRQVFTLSADLVELAQTGAFAVGWALSLYLTLGAIRVFGEIANGNDSNVAMLAGEFARYPTALLAQALALGLTIAGLCALVIPGVLVYMGLQFVLFIVVHERAGPLAALTRSWNLTEGRKANLFLVQLVLVTVMAFTLGCIPYVGALLIWPIMTLAQTVMYRSLLYYEDLYS